MGVHIMATLALAAVAPQATDAKPPSVYGIVLTMPITIPECGTFTDPVKFRKKYREYNTYPYAEPTASPCYWRSDRSKAGTGQPLVYENIDVHFPRNAAPAHGFGFRALMIDDNVHAVQWATRGLREQEFVLAELKEKFGTPTSTTVETKQNAFGAKFESVRASWSLPQTVTLVFEGSSSRIDQGSVAMMTEVARARVIDELKKADTRVKM